jgi:glucuronate isomerase
MAMAVDDPDAYNVWLDRLAAVSGQSIQSYDDLLAALEVRHAFFHEHGCRLSDHGLDQIYAEDTSLERVRNSFKRVRSGVGLSVDASRELKSALLHEFGLMDHARGWVQQLHIGALRNNNTRMLQRLGPNVGFDSMGDAALAAPLNRFLDRLDESEQLAKTILYNINPRDNDMLATLIGNFQQGPGAGKIQFGAAWWFLDQLDGMTRQLDALSNMGLLSRFVGMLTDSRSFLSYSRHEYFRRLLCNLLGGEVERGLLPRDLGLLGELVADVCYRNAKEYFPWA